MKAKYTKKQIEEFLRESNKIEGVHSEEMFEDALKAWRYLARQKELTYEVVLETHRLLMVNSKLEDKYIGKIRYCDVFIGGRAGLSPNLIRGALSSWLKDVETSVRIPGEDGKHFKLNHIEYERIPGFADGNGRTGRMFMNWSRMQAGLPILIIHADWPEIGGETSEYYSWFR